MKKSSTFSGTTTSEYKGQNLSIEKKLPDIFQSNFIFVLSHDLRRPLRAIQGFSKLLEKKYGALFPEEAKNFLKLIMDSSNELDQQIEDLVSYLKLKPANLQIQTIVMNDFVNTIIHELMGSDSKNKFEIKVLPLPSCEADPTLLKVVFVNLIANAIKYSNSSNTPIYIEIGSIEQTGETVFYVKDKGVGIDMEYAEKLFGIFKRFHSAEEYIGNGIGLAKVKLAIDLHQGRLWVETEVGKGSTFYFTLGCQ